MRSDLTEVQQGQQKPINSTPLFTAEQSNVRWYRTMYWIWPSHATWRKNNGRKDINQSMINHQFVNACTPQQKQHTAVPGKHRTRTTRAPKISRHPTGVNIVGATHEWQLGIKLCNSLTITDETLIKRKAATKFGSGVRHCYKSFRPVTRGSLGAHNPNSSRGWNPLPNHIGEDLPPSIKNVPTNIGWVQAWVWWNACYGDIMLTAD